MIATEVKDLHIIIAEDDLDDGEFMYKSFMKHPSFRKVDWAKNGKALLEMLQDNKKPDIILTDINMPIISGIEAIEALFRDPDYSTIPIFACSSTSNPIYKTKCMALGTKGFLVKPFDLFEYDLFPSHIVSVLGKNLNYPPGFTV
jgi:CheY-like chemotaxis protein